jgi:HlyD family secretion protein
MKKSWRTALWVLAAIAVAALLAYALLPAPVDADVAAVSRGPMSVTADEQGETRNHDRYVISAPVAGRLQRIVLRSGDAVQAGQTVAELAPLPLGVRERAEGEARLAAARGLSREAREHLLHARADLAQAERDLARAQDLHRKGFVPVQSVEQAANMVDTTRNETAAADFRARAAAADVDAARAGLLAAAAPGSATLIALHAPVAGRVLQVPDDNERVVAAGTPLLVLGDMRRLEVVIEFLSSDAVGIRPGMPVLFDGWGGARTLHGRVRVVEPWAFTKISALGVEEKRTRVIADFSDDPAPLGDGFRVNAHVLLWSSADTLRVPASALFRCGSNWCAYVVDGGRARQREVSIGQRNPSLAEVRGGLQDGTRVILYPDNRLADGARIRVRAAR